jgi:hypothetical protein
LTCTGFCFQLLIPRRETPMTDEPIIIPPVLWF